MIELVSPFDFPRHSPRTAKPQWAEIWAACVALRGTEEGQGVKVSIPEGVTPAKAQHKAHTAFQWDPRWKVETRVRDGILFIRKRKS